MILSCKLENCYGIKYFNQSFDFSQSKSILIYASNGIMKTSFARTFEQLQDGKQPEEKIYEKVSTAEITINGTSISANEIFVINPYIDKYKDASISTLLVDEDSKKQYETELEEILKLKTSLLEKLSKKSGKASNGLESLILKDFDSESDFFTFLSSLTDLADDNNQYLDIKYGHIFDDKVLGLLNNETVQKNIREYSEIYNKLLENTPFFDKGAFNPSKAEALLKSLEKNHFFTKQNKIKLTNVDSLLSHKELQESLDKANENLIKNKKLKKIQDLITKNAQVQAFQSLIEEKPDLINDLNDLPTLKKKIWLSYFSKCKEDIKSLLLSYKEKKSTLQNIEDKAIIEKTRWNKVVKIFEQRFVVPFSLDIEDSKSVILGQSVPNIVFKFKDSNEQYNDLSKEKLENHNTLSQGERRALYFLNIIFEIESRIEQNTKTLFVIDDIADSFDYRNKYAIIQYLKELPTKAEGRFFQIILTHNFDFFRTVQERILNNSNKRNCSFIAQKCQKEEVSLIKAGDKNVISPLKYWKDQFKHSNDLKFVIAAIPFIRELLGYFDDQESHDIRDKLTALLHFKDNTTSIKFSELQGLYKKNWKLEIKKEQENITVFNQILSTAKEISNCGDGESSFNLENKIILAIASRLNTERYIKSCGIELQDTLGQTFNLFVDTNKHDDSKYDEIKLLEEVVIMTPENIHLNSFMYEPIIDMSDLHLKKLYNKISNLLM